ncbi:MAG: hypothetical protein IPL43_15855 [Micropruina sp.]|nr:hypothetical protein [Micropruina sp.]
MELISAGVAVLLSAYFGVIAWVQLRQPVGGRMSPSARRAVNAGRLLALVGLVGAAGVLVGIRFPSIGMVAGVLLASVAIGELALQAHRRTPWPRLLPMLAAFPLAMFYLGFRA